MVKPKPIPDPERNIAVNTGTDPQRPGAPAKATRAGDAHPPGTSAAETSVPTDSATASGEPGPGKGPEDRREDVGRGGVE